MASLLGAVDSDDDQAMSAAEIAAAVTTLDADRNGWLDHRDHVPGPPADDPVHLIGLLLPRLREFDISSLGNFG
jgi:hypothetical protein